MRYIRSGTINKDYAIQQNQQNLGHLQIGAHFAIKSVPDPSRKMKLRGPEQYYHKSRPQYKGHG